MAKTFTPSTNHQLSKTLMTSTVTQAVKNTGLNSKQVNSLISQMKKAKWTPKRMENFLLKLNKGNLKSMLQANKLNTQVRKLETNTRADSIRAVGQALAYNVTPQTTALSASAGATHVYNAKTNAVQNANTLVSGNATQSEGEVDYTIDDEGTISINRR